MNLKTIKLRLVLTLLSLCCVSFGPAAEPTEQTSGVIQWQAPVTVATGPAEVGPWRMNESEFNYVDDASVALRDDGEIALVWADNERKDVFFQRYSSGNEVRFEAPSRVSRSPGIFSWLPRVVFGEGEQVYAVWQEIVFSGGSHGGEIFFARSTDGGGSFNAPVNLSQTVNGAGKGRVTEKRWDNGSLDIAVGPRGEIVVAWTEYQGALRLRRSTDGGRSFSAALQVTGSAERPARGPSLAFGKDQNLFLVWTLGGAREADIQMARSTDGGQSFAAPQTPFPSSGYSDKPDLAADAGGTLHLAFAESSGGPFAPSQLRYARLDASGEPLGEAKPVANDMGGGGESAPSLALDTEGGVYILWEQDSTVGDFARGLGIGVSLDAGASFAQASLVPGSLDSEGGINGSLQGELASKLSVNSSGRVAVVNSHFRPGQQSRVILIRGQREQ